MNHECEGVGRVVQGDPPPNTATTCPVCGRGTRVDPQETDQGLNFTIGSHQTVVQESP
jgi:hypothetical protein